MNQAAGGGADVNQPCNPKCAHTIKIDPDTKIAVLSLVAQVEIGKHQLNDDYYLGIK